MDKLELSLMQKRGMAHARKSIDVVISALIVVLIIGAIAGQYFTAFGTRTGLGNTTLNPDVPAWLPSILIILAGVGILYIVYDVFIK